MSVDYIEQLKNNLTYKQMVQKLEQLEKARIYCHHDLEHFETMAEITLKAADTLRIDVEEEHVRLAALLHDLGRIREYEDGTPHEAASVAIAERLLTEIGYPSEKQKKVIDFIESHRSFDKKLFFIKEAESLQKVMDLFNNEEKILFLFAWADKRSRACWKCHANESCNWPDAMKNKEMIER